MNDIICKFNEHVLLISHYNPMNELLLFPFSVSLHFSLINKNENCLYNNLAILDSYITTLVRNILYTYIIVIIYNMFNI